MSFVVNTKISHTKAVVRMSRLSALVLLISHYVLFDSSIAAVSAFSFSDMFSQVDPRVEQEKANPKVDSQREQRVRQNSIELVRRANSKVDDDRVRDELEKYRKSLPENQSAEFYAEKLYIRENELDALTDSYNKETRVITTYRSKDHSNTGGTIVPSCGVCGIVALWSATVSLISAGVGMLIACQQFHPSRSCEQAFLTLGTMVATIGACCTGIAACHRCVEYRNFRKKVAEYSVRMEDAVNMSKKSSGDVGSSDLSNAKHSKVGSDDDKKNFSISVLRRPANNLNFLHKNTNIVPDRTDYSFFLQRHPVDPFSEILENPAQSAIVFGVGVLGFVFLLGILNCFWELREIKNDRSLEEEIVTE